MIDLLQHEIKSFLTINPFKKKNPNTKARIEKKEAK